MHACFLADSIGQIERLTTWFESGSLGLTAVCAILFPVVKQRPSTDIEAYCSCIERVRNRINLTQSVINGLIDAGDEELNLDLIFLLLRKSLEEIVLASFSSSRTEYLIAYNHVSNGWRSDTLSYLGKLNPNFYPTPLTKAGRGQRFNTVTEGYLTKQDFAKLYREADVMLHASNHHSTDDLGAGGLHETSEWLEKIKVLLNWHSVGLINSSRAWLVNVPFRARPVRAFDASDIDIETQP